MPSGMNAPKLAIGDGALGFWSALEDIFKITQQQRCWMHKTVTVLNCMPKTVQGKATQDLHEIWQSGTKANAEKAFDLLLAFFSSSTLAKHTHQ